MPSLCDLGMLIMIGIRSSLRKLASPDGDQGHGTSSDCSRERPWLVYRPYFLLNDSHFFFLLEDGAGPSARSK